MPLSKSGVASRNRPGLQAPPVEPVSTPESAEVVWGVSILGTASHLSMGLLPCCVLTECDRNPGHGGYLRRKRARKKAVRISRSKICYGGIIDSRREARQRGPTPYCSYEDTLWLSDETKTIRLRDVCQLCSPDSCAAQKFRTDLKSDRSKR